MKKQDYRILIVDDEPANVYLLSRMLRDSYRIAEARSGEEALAIARGPDKPALVLLDVMMPEIDGLEVCRQLKADDETKDIIVIFVTAIGDSAAEEVGLNLGAADYITKPISLPIVRARVRNQINMRLKADMLEAMSYIDGLTHVYNRRRFDTVLHKEWQRGRRTGLPLALIMIDFDHFKALNDHYGHGAGDICLQQGAAALSSVLKRQDDLLARYGGEEFVALLPETDLEGARKAAEEMRQAVKALALEHQYSSAAGHVTVSLGVAATVPDEHHQATHLLELADRALNRAKARGRDCVVMMETSLETELGSEHVSGPQPSGDAFSGYTQEIGLNDFEEADADAVKPTDRRRHCRTQAEFPLGAEPVLSTLTELYSLPLSAEARAELDEIVGLTNGLMKRLQAEGVYPDRHASAEAEGVQPPGLASALHSPLLQRPVLIVEDDHANRVVLDAMLSKLGHGVIETAADGAAALEALRRRDFALVLMDCGLPDCDGADLVESIRSGTAEVLNSKTLIIGMSGLTDEVSQRRCLDAGMNAFLTKPLDIDQLKEAVARQLWPAETRIQIATSALAETVGLDSDDPLFDAKELLRRLGGDQEIAVATIEQFLTDAPTRLQELRTAVDVEEMEKVRFKAHSLKGLAGAVSAPRLQRFAEKLEKSAPTAEAARLLVERIEREYRSLEPLLRAQLTVAD